MFWLEFAKIFRCHMLYLNVNIFIAKSIKCWTVSCLAKTTEHYGRIKSSAYHLGILTNKGFIPFTPGAFEDHLIRHSISGPVFKPFHDSVSMKIPYPYSHCFSQRISTLVSNYIIVDLNNRHWAEQASKRSHIIIIIITLFYTKLWGAWGFRRIGYLETANKMHTHSSVQVKNC